MTPLRAERIPLPGDWLPSHRERGAFFSRRAAIWAVAVVVTAVALGSVSLHGARDGLLEDVRHAAIAPQHNGAPAPRIEQWPNKVWFLFRELSACGRGLPKRDRWRIAGAIHDQSQRYGYDPLFVLALVEVESSCSPSARGPRGALGLLQIKPSTARAICSEMGWSWYGAAALSWPSVNLRLGLHYLAELEKQYGDRYLALAAYNMGPTRASEMQRWQARRTPYVRRIAAQYDEIQKRSRRTSPADVTPDW